jgi:hypothetical protein
MLPRSLESLDLDEVWVDGDCPELTGYGEKIEYILRGIVLENGPRLPNLRSVRFKNDAMYWRESLLSVDLLSGRAGVDFSVVKWFPD